MGNMRFKVGDRVRIKSLDWYNENKDEYGYVRCTDFLFTPEHSKYCGCEFTISHITEFQIPSYVMENNGHEWTDEMIEGLVEEKFGTALNPLELKSNANCLTQNEVDVIKPKPKFKLGDKIKLKSTLLNDIFGVIGYESEGYRITNISNGLTYFMSYSIEHYYELVEEEVGLVDNLSSRWVNEFNLPDGYIFKDENGNEILTSKIILEKKKKEYPKTYEECCKIIDYALEGETIIGYKASLLRSLQKLLICRNAYWKLYGDEMGLGKPWEPTMETVYCISRNYSSYCGGKSNILEFPTAEMRDAFYKNFTDIIESCKELL